VLAEINLTRQPPLLPTTPMSRQKLSEFQKGQIDGASRFRHMVAEIEKVLDFARSTICNVIACIKIRGFSENKERVGRPRKSLDRDNRLLIRKAMEDTKMPLRKLKFESNSDLSISTIQRRLKEQDIKKWLAAEQPRLTETHTSKPFKWSKEHRHLMVDDWRKYIWSDKCSVEKSADPRQMWIFQHPDDAEKYKPQNVKPKDKCKGVSVMIWGCFASNIRSPLTVYHGHMKAVQYVNILKKNLLPFITLLLDESEKMYHSSKTMLRSIQLMLRKGGSTTMKFPSLNGCQIPQI
jgi:hypothetical protein